MDLDEATILKGEVETRYPSATLLPVARFPTRSVYSQAKKDFGTVYKVPSTASKFLTSIEKARNSR